MGNYTQSAVSWLVIHGWKVLAIAAGAYAVQKIGVVLVKKAIRKSLRTRRFQSAEAEKKREDTLIKIFLSTINVVVWVVAAIMILSEFGVDTTPLLAAAGVTGLAFGFGGQYLIKDVISGFFIIVENQYRVGDVVCFEGICGQVEDITLRVTILRDLDGTVYHVPHGEIKKTANLSKHFARVNLNVGISYKSDLEKAIAVIDRVGRELAEDPAWNERVIKAPRFLRVDDFADSAIIVKILGDTKPLAQWDVTGELRRRLKAAFDKEGIEIPFPQMVVHGGAAGRAKA